MTVAAQRKVFTFFYSLSNPRTDGRRVMFFKSRYITLPLAHITSQLGVYWSRAAESQPVTLPVHLSARGISDT